MEIEVSLNRAPTSEVRINLSGSPETECSINTDTLVFTPDNWDQPQTIVVTGLDDDEQDGNQVYKLQMVAASDDADFNGISIEPIQIINRDNDGFGSTYGVENALVYLRPDAGLETDDYGTRSYLMFSLPNRPAYPVTVTLTSSDPTVAVPEVHQFVIEPDLWNEIVEIPVFGIDDKVRNGNRPFNIQISVACDDPTFEQRAYDFTTEEFKNEVSGMTYDLDEESKSSLIVEKVSDGSDIDRHFLYVVGTVTEDGQECIDYDISLSSAPFEDKSVLVYATVSDPTEGRVTPKSVSFDQKDWNKPKTFRICGVDDDESDGDMLFSVLFETHSDAFTHTELSSDVIVIKNKDDEPPLTEAREAGIIVRTQYAVSYTNEYGQSKPIYVRLSNQPTEDVIITSKTSDSSEGKAYREDDMTANKPPSLVFTPLNWNEEQIIRVVGQDDDEEDGDIPYDITFTSQSDDEAFNNLTSEPVHFLNKDNELTVAAPPSNEDTVVPNTDLIVVSGVDKKDLNPITGESTFWISLSNVDRKGMRRFHAFQWRQHDAEVCRTTGFHT